VNVYNNIGSYMYTYLDNNKHHWVNNSDSGWAVHGGGFVACSKLHIVQN